MRLFLYLFFFILIFTSCNPLHHLNKITSEKAFLKTEKLNFEGEKANTQWWYFDCVLEDGAILVFLFTPHQWWDEKEKSVENKSMFYISYMYPNGNLKSINKVFDRKTFRYSDSSLTTPYFTLIKAHKKKERNYKIEFNLEDFKGSVNITSNIKAYSPLPTGKIGPFINKRILKLKGNNLSFRYASHVPQGRVTGDVEIDNRSVKMFGKAYHEQGWFTGTPNQMGEGWAWYHFVSKNINIFGKPGGFMYLEKDGKRLLQGVSFKESKLYEKSHLHTENKFVNGGKLKFHTRKRSFEIAPSGSSAVPLIYIPAGHTSQVWGTIMQPSKITFSENNSTIVEEGVLFLETSIMGLIIRDGDR